MYRIFFLLLFSPILLLASPFEEGSPAIAQQEVYQSEYWRVLVDYSPNVPGHLLIVPKRRVRDRHHLTRDEHGDLYDVEQAVYLALQKRMGEGTDNLQLEKNGDKAGTSVSGHFHIHVYPMPEALSFWQQLKLILRIALFPPGQLSDEELAQEVELYKAAFEQAEAALWQEAQ